MIIIEYRGLEAQYSGVVVRPWISSTCESLICLKQEAFGSQWEQPAGNLALLLA